MLAPAAEQTESAIDALYTAWRDAFRRGDVAATLALLTPDYTLWAAGKPPVGVDALRSHLESAFVTYEIEATFERVERVISGPLAVDFGWDVQTVRPRAGGETRTARQRVCLVLRQTADGRWQFARAMAQPGPAQ